jgi:hypothetical protein
MTMLADYLESVTRRRGLLDCCAFMADWLVANDLPDPMGGQRGTYTTRREYRALIRREGGIMACCSRRLAALGLRETNSPQTGDVALVMAPFAVRHGRPLFAPTGAICISPTQRALVALDAALVIATLPTVKAWRLAGG